MNKDELESRHDGTTHISARIRVELLAEIDCRRKLWDLQSRGEVLEAMLGWMVEGAN